MMLRLGVDVGGTNTDAVLLDPDGQIVAAIKRPTSEDITSGVRDAIQGILADHPAAQVGLAALGTTQCTNAVVERRGLRRVGVLRIGAPATTAVPPLADWPDDIRDTVLVDSAVVRGGHHVDGRLIAPLDEDAIAATARRWRGVVEAVAVTAVFSPITAEHEQRAAAIVARELDVPISVSHEIGSTGLLERENATIINATLTGVAERATRAFSEVLGASGMRVQPYLSQNDGTLMSLERAAQYPVLTIASGPTNSLRGGAFLSGLREAIVIDVGGTTSDVGVLASGFPRESAIAMDVGGVRTNFRMPDLTALALGGGTVVHLDTAPPRVGPDSVGHRITTRARCFGGDTLTMTDVAVALGHARLGTTPDRAGQHLDPDTLEQAWQVAADRLSRSLDRMRSSDAEVTVVAVGGGAFLVPDELPGVKTVVRPPHHEVANAVGAAMAEVSGTVDWVVELDGRDRGEVVVEAIQEARAQAVEAGADGAELRVIDVEEVALAYLPGTAVRVRARVAGPLRPLAHGWGGPRE